MDFSEAERLGFILGFTEFWMTRHDNTRSMKELHDAAGILLRGCREHYRAGVTQISKISAVIPPDMADTFKHQALSLLDVSDPTEFLSLTTLLVRDFPMTKSWLNWWMRESHASMLFLSQRKMKPELWKAIPETTNAEEAMHWKMYSATGRDHGFLEGMHSLYAIAQYYQRIHTGSQSKREILPVIQLLIGL